jgi:hypothetical protein
VRPTKTTYSCWLANRSVTPGRNDTHLGVGLPDALAAGEVRNGDTIDLGVAGREQVTKDVKVQDPQTKEIRIEPQLLLRNKLTATVKEITETSEEARHLRLSNGS